MNDPLDVIIVGPGRLGRTAEQILLGAGHRVRMVGRGETIPTGPLTWLTVPDTAIRSVAPLVPPGGILLHASGTTPVDALRPHPAAGSLHPLMTFPGPAHPPAPPIPAAIDGDPPARSAARALARALGFTPFPAPADRRLYHAAAVMAGNFATVLLAQASEVLTLAGVPASQAPSLLAPLALTSIRNAVEMGFTEALTGPIARGEGRVIQGHREALEAAPAELRAVYESLLQAGLRLQQGD